MDTSIKNHWEHKKLLSIFFQDFYRIHRHMMPSYKKRLVDLAPYLFDRWYFTTLAEETLLSPANVAAWEFENKGNAKSELAYVILPKENAKKEDMFEYYSLLYTLTDHPLIHDLYQVVSFCSPAMDLAEDGMFLPEQQEVVLGKLSRKDCFYLEYLILLAWKKELLIDLPAIHAKKCQANSGYRAFFQRPHKEILLDLVDGALDITSEKFTILLDADWDFFTKETFAAYLQDGQNVDDIFADIYSLADVDIRSIWEKAPTEELSQEEHMVLSSFYYLGVLLEKWFLAPLSIFFRMIRPLYCTPHSFVLSLNTLVALLIMKNDPSMELFMPPSMYSLTAMGKELFDISTDSPEKNNQALPKKLDFSDIWQAVEEQVSLRRFEESVEDKLQQQSQIYTFHIFLKGDKRLWKKIEISEHTLLSEFCLEILHAFGFDMPEGYRIIIPDENEFPVEYGWLERKRTLNQADNIRLEELPLHPEGTLLLIPEGYQKMQLEIRYEKKTLPKPYTLYPRIQKQSKRVSEEEKLGDLF